MRSERGSGCDGSTDNEAPGIATAPSIRAIEGAHPKAYAGEVTRSMARRWWVVALALACCPLPGCGDAGGAAAHRSEETSTLLFVGDVILGRGVAAVVAGDPEGLFADARYILRSADIALANLESPLSRLPHTSANPNTLVADPDGASLLASAGFDVVNLANNHAGDAGAPSVLDTMRAVSDVGLAFVGAGANDHRARSPLIVTVGATDVAILAFDVTGAGLRAGSGAGVEYWDTKRAELAIRAAAMDHDVVVVSLHGGVEYLPTPDPRMSEIADSAVEWGADVVWGHGPHVAYPVRSLGSGDRTAVVAESLGNFLFDQRGTMTGRGSVLEVMVDRNGVIAYHTGATSHHDLRVHFVGWDLPLGDAALLDGAWWALVDPSGAEASSIEVERFPWGDVIAASAGRVTSRDRDEVAISFRKPAVPHAVRDGLPDIQWTDLAGRTPHLGIYTADDLTALWVASMVPRPIASVVACDGSLAMAYSTLDDPGTVATGAAVWRPRELVASTELPGPGTPACLDVDRDGRSDPVILDR
jgi:hypothetical protein